SSRWRHLRHRVKRTVGPVPGDSTRGAAAARAGSRSLAVGLMLGCPPRPKGPPEIHHGGRFMPNTVRLHRVIATGPDKIYRAFLEPDALAKWMPPNGFTCTVHTLEAKVGGSFRMSFRNFTTGQGHSFGGKYLELVPGERVRYTDAFDDPNL